MGLSVQTVAATHAPDHGRGDAFGIRHRFVGRHVVGQIVFVDAPEGSQECTQAGARTFTTVAVNFAHPIAIIITRPFGSTPDTRSKQMAWPTGMCDAAPQVPRAVDWRS
jgi:hypothetical protein